MAFFKGFEQLSLNKKPSKKLKSRNYKKKPSKDPEIQMNFKKDYLKALTLPDNNPYRPDEPKYFDFLKYLLPSMNQDPEIVLIIVNGLF